MPDLIESRCGLRFDDSRRMSAHEAHSSSSVGARMQLVGRMNEDEYLDRRAAQSLRRALCLDDSRALGHFWLGNLYRERGDVARDLQEYENVVRHWERRTLQMTEESSRLI